MLKCPICETLNDDNPMCLKCDFGKNENSLSPSSSAALLPPCIAKSPKEKLSASAAHKLQILGECYELTKGVPKNLQKALYYYTIAAKAGDAEAQYHLGRCYAWGVGVEVDEERAFYWYQKAADQNNADAQFDLGDCYSYGCSVPMNQEEAIKWYRKAAEQNKPLALYRLGECYHDGMGVPRSKKQALIWYQKAADAGYRQGKDMVKNLTKRKWFF